MKKLTLYITTIDQQKPTVLKVCSAELKEFEKTMCGEYEDKIFKIEQEGYVIGINCLYVADYAYEKLEK